MKAKRNDKELDGNEDSYSDGESNDLESPGSQGDAEISCSGTCDAPKEVIDREKDGDYQDYYVRSLPQDIWPTKSNFPAE